MIGVVRCWLIGLALAAPAASQTPAAVSPQSVADWRASRFDLSRLLPATVSAVSEATVGGDLPLGGRLVASLEAGERERGAAVTIGTIAPLFQREASVSGRAGLLVDGRSLVFGRLGYSEYTLDQAFTRSGSRDRTAGGLLIGAGAETRLSRSFTVRTEYQSVDYARDLANRRLLGTVALRY